MLYVKKRNNSLQKFDGKKIETAISKAMMAVALQNSSVESFQGADVKKIYLSVLKHLDGMDDGISIEEIQNIVENKLMSFGFHNVAKAYILYREKQAEKRNLRDNLMKDLLEVRTATDKLNANIVNSPSAKMLQCGGIATKLLAHKIFPEEFMNAHENGDIHIHDLDFSLFTVNCLQIPVKRLLLNGFDNGHGFIRPPKRIGSAAALACILIQSSQSDMFGGQSIPSFDSALSPFVYKDTTDKEIYQAMESLIFNLNSMHSRAGAQVPFSSLNVGLDTSEAARRITKQLLLAYEKGLGKGENPIFPNVLFKVKKGVNRFKSDPNYDLFQLAIRVASRRMNPTFVFMDTSFNSPYESVDYMGCRTRVISNINGDEVGEGRGNLFFVTLNLPRLGILAKKNMEKFWSLLDSKIDLCVRQLLNRYDIVKTLKVKDIPFVMGQHLYYGSENLQPEDTIEEAIRQGTLSMGFIGLAETLVALTGKHHGESDESLALGLQIVKHMQDKMLDATKEYHLNFGLFATPAEGLSGRFTEKDQKIFGKIEGVTDRDYYTNSFHVPVYFKITHYKKMSIEGQFHKYCPAGHISYVEFEAPPINNLLAVEKELNHMADSDVGYAGINFPIDFCNDCGFQGVINGDDCPVCGAKHSVVHIRRITGYLSSVKNFNKAKSAEVKDRQSSAL